MFRIIALLILAIGCSSPTAPPPTPEEAHAALTDQGVPYSQASFLAVARDGDRSVVEAFLHAGMDPDSQNEDQGFNTALMGAARQGHIDIVKLLIESGANPNLTNARCGSHLPFPGLQVEDPPNCLRQTALAMAAYEGHFSIVEFLVESGASLRDDTWLKPRDGPDTPLMLAAAAGHLRIVEYIVPRVTVTVTPGGQHITLIDGGNGALMFAAYGGHIEVARYLLDTGHVDVNPPAQLGGRGEGYTALMLAALNNQQAMIHFLLEQGGDIHVRVARFITFETSVGMIEGVSIYKSYGVSALTLAAAHGHTQALRILLEHWVKTYGSDGRDDHGRTTLMYAAQGGDTTTMQWLLDNGAPLHAISAAGNNALMFAVVEGHVEAVAMLLALGADTTVVNDNNRTVLSLAEAYGHAEVVNLLEGTSDQTKTPLSGVLPNHELRHRYLGSRRMDIPTEAQYLVVGLTKLYPVPMQVMAGLTEPSIYFGAHAVPTSSTDCDYSRIRIVQLGFGVGFASPRDELDNFFRFLPQFFAQIRGLLLTKSSF